MLTVYTHCVSAVQRKGADWSKVVVIVLSPKRPSRQTSFQTSSYTKCHCREHRNAEEVNMCHLHPTMLEADISPPELCNSPGFTCPRLL